MIRSFVTFSVLFNWLFLSVVVVLELIDDDVGVVFVLAQGSYVLSLQPEAGTSKYRLVRLAKFGPHHKLPWSFL